MIYDFIIVGSGSAGAHTAYFLKKSGAKVLVVEQNIVASGASYAAGAFISPRLGRGGILQKWTNKAFKFSIDFYKKNFSEFFYQTGILRLPKDEEDAKKFEEYEKFIDVDYKRLKPDEIEGLKDYAKQYGGFLFEEGGVVESISVCKELLRDIEVKENFQIFKIEKKDDLFLVGDLKAKSVILATGAWEELLPKYIKIGKVAGFRFDVDVDFSLKYSVHKRISISAKIGDRVIIGATHKRVEDILCPTKPNSFLIDEAKKMVQINKIEILKMYCGVRPSIYDHLPVIGEIIDIDKTLEKFPNFKKGQKIDSKEIEKVENLFLINGFGGRGFVFGPFMAKKLADYILEKKSIEKELSVDRIFQRFVKKELN